MTNKPSFDLAKQGDPQEIARLITYLIKEQEIIAFAELKQDYLEITLESTSVPHQQKSVKFVQRVMEKLNCPYIKSVLIQGKELALEKPVWTECISLGKKTKLVKNKSSFNFITWLKWPAWFPYPNSWLRTIVLIIWVIFIIKITTFWGGFIGVIISDIETDPRPFLQALGIAFLISGVIYSYAHHWIFNRSLRYFSPWTPHYKSLWEGIYALIVFFLSILIVLGVLIPFYPIQDCYSYITQNFQIQYCRFGDHQEWGKLAGLLQILCILYLYQIEYLICKNPQIKKNMILMGCIGLITAVSIPLYSKNIENIQNLGSWVVSYLPEWGRTEKIETVNKTEVSTILNQNSETPTEINYFRDAIATATNAANLAQTSKSKDEWEFVASQWKKAIENMKAVSTSDINYSKAQQRVIQYQKNLDYARLAASRAK
ncbi:MULTISPECIES: hypothetical protein [Planktothrix]|uniref:hypothetical protein n=1 Tax=Planktothrix TaxID=54304 RepID=UPI0003F96DB5|nr:MULTISPECIES: hypothetical protein [Planktothrix]CAD0227374.1 conserved membrane hypothetical protein [Planktothrix agardhii]CAH2574695.1 hypothetical protein PRNO82_04058 [Planktothrix rubescens]